MPVSGESVTTSDLPEPAYAVFPASGPGLMTMSWFKARSGLYGRITRFPKFSVLAAETVHLLPLLGLPIEGLDVDKLTKNRS